MNMVNNVQFSDLGDLPMSPELRAVMEPMLLRLDTIVRSLSSQLQASPTVFTVDPTNEDNLEFIAGAKPGDVSIYKDGAGAVQVHVFD